MNIRMHVMDAVVPEGMPALRAITAVRTDLGEEWAGTVVGKAGDELLEETVQRVAEVVRAALVGEVVVRA